MYTVSTAARISISSLESEARNASAAPWNRAWMLAGMPRSCCDCFDRLHRFTQRRTGREVEGHCHDRELALVIDGKRAGLLGQPGDRAQRHCAAGRRVQVDVRQCRRPFLKLGLHFQDHAILVELGKDGGNLPLAERVVQRVVDQLRREPEARCSAAIDVQHRPQALILLIAGDVTQHRNVVEPLHQPLRPDGELLGIGILQGVLILRAADPVFDRQVLHRLHEQADAVDFRELGLQRGGSHPMR